MHIANKKDCAFGVLLLMGSAYFYSLTYSFRKVAYFSVGPTAFPRIILGSLILLSVILIFQSLSFKPKEDAPKAEKKPMSDADKKGLIASGAFVFLMLGYVALLPVAGYVAASVGFLFLGMLLLGKRTLKMTAVYLGVSMVSAFAMQYIFQNLLHLFLP